MKNKFAKITLLLVLAIPIIANAQFGTVERWINRAGDLIALLIPILVAIALLVFFWGLVKFISKAGDENEIANGRRLMIWGLVALFVMITVWGLVNFIRQQLNINQDNAPALPFIPRP